jgi:streptogramin lyase
LWTQREIRPTNQPGDLRVAHQLGRSDISGMAPQQFQTTIPIAAVPEQAWAAPNGAWYVATVESDGQRNPELTLTVWYVRPDGTASRLACQRATDGEAPFGSRSGVTLTAGAVVDGGMYVALEKPDRSWTVAAVDNPGASGNLHDGGTVDGSASTDGNAGIADAGPSGASCPAPGDAAAGSSGQLTEFQIPTPNGTPHRIIKGPDGALYFGQVQTRSLGRITTSGCITEFKLGVSPFSIVSGPNNYLWFTQTGIDSIGRMLVDGSLFEQLPIARGAQRPLDIALGADGNLWFTQSAPSAIGRMTLTGTVTEFPTPTASAGPRYVTLGPDGAIWFSEPEPGRIGRVDPTSNTITEFPIPGGLSVGRLVTGSDGSFWLTAAQAPATPKLMRLTTSGTTTEVPFPADRRLAALTVGPDGHLWMLDEPANRITRMSPTNGTFSDFPVPTPNAGLTDMAFGPDGNIWFTEIKTNKIGRLIP